MKVPVISMKTVTFGEKILFSQADSTFSYFNSNQNKRCNMRDRTISWHLKQYLIDFIFKLKSIIVFKTLTASNMYFVMIKLGFNLPSFAP